MAAVGDATIYVDSLRERCRIDVAGATGSTVPLTVWGSVPPGIELVRGARLKIDVDERADLLHSTTGTTKSDCERGAPQERLAKLSGGVTVTKVGGRTASSSSCCARARGGRRRAAAGAHNARPPSAPPAPPPPRRSCDRERTGETAA